MEACEEPGDFSYLYEVDEPLKDVIGRIATGVYGADGVTYSPEAEEKIAAADEDPEMKSLGTCMVKTHLSLSHDPARKGRPRGWQLPVRDLLVYRGSGFVVPVAGDIKLMPGTGSDPAFRRIDVDVETGKVRGLT